MNNTKPNSLKQTIKSHSPEITLVVAAAGVIAYALVTRKKPTVNHTAFVKNAMDPTVEIITGSDEAFAVLSIKAMNLLEEDGELTLHEGMAGTFKILFTEAKA